MCLALHPFVTGQPLRSRYLDRALAHIASHRDIWLATSDEIAQWYFENAYASAVAQEAEG